MPTLNILDLAQWFLEKEAMEHQRIQKLCYFAVAWHYAINEEPLVNNDTFQAQVHGPASPILWEKYHEYMIEKYPKQDTITDFGKVTEQFLEMIYSWYSNYSTHNLEILSQYGDPWIKARGNLKEIDAGYTFIDTNAVSYTHLTLPTKRIV